MRRTNAAARLSLLATLLVAASSVHAGGFTVARFGGEHGNPIDSNPTSIYYNPAGLAGIGGWRLYVEGEFALRSLHSTRDPLAIDGDHASDPNYVAADSGKGGLTNRLASPFIGVATNFGVEGLGVGVGAFVPFGGDATFDKRDSQRGSQYPGALDGPQRWQD